MYGLLAGKEQGTGELHKGQAPIQIGEPYLYTSGPPCFPSVQVR